MRTPSGVSIPRRTKMRYSEIITIASNSGGLATYTFRANSIYDPNLSGVGHKPMGSDTYESLFDHYMVTGAKINVKCLMDTSQTAPFVYGVYLGDGSAVPYTDTTEFIEGKRGSWRTAVGRQAKSLSCSAKFSCKKFFNVKDPKDNRENLGAAFGSNPSEGAFFYIWYQNATAATDTQTFVVTVDYIVTFFEPKDIAQS